MEDFVESSVQSSPRRLPQSDVEDTPMQKLRAAEALCSELSDDYVVPVSVMLEQDPSIPPAFLLEVKEAEVRLAQCTVKGVRLSIETLIASKKKPATNVKPIPFMLTQSPASERLAQASQPASQLSRGNTPRATEGPSQSPQTLPRGGVSPPESCLSRQSATTSDAGRSDRNLNATVRKAFEIDLQKDTWRCLCAL